LNTIEDLLRRLKRRENLQIVPLSRAKSRDDYGTPSASEPSREPRLPTIPGTADRMPGLSFGDKDRQDDLRSGEKYFRKQLQMFYKKLEGII